MNRDDDPQLWDILGRAPEPRVSPFFARNVLRELRPETAPRPRIRTWLPLRLLIPAAGVAVAVIGLVAIFQSASTPRNVAVTAPQTAPSIDLPTTAPEPIPTTNALPEQPDQVATTIDSQTSESDMLAKIDPQDYDVVANLDDLLVLYESSLWDENSTL